MLAGVHHVALTVDDLGAARRFYGGQLGLEEIERPDFGVPGAWYGLGAQQVHIVELPTHRPTDPSHFAIQVDDLDAVVADLEAKGVEVRRARSVAGAGQQANIKDPAGNLSELNQPA
jgi:glyoxylase I family protein